jgi:hypothetical protein
MNYSNSKPNLINSKTIKQIDKVFNNIKKSEPTWNENMKLFYKKYVSHNIFAILVLFLLVIYLTMRYVIKTNKIKKTKFRKRKKRKKHKKTRSDERFNIKYNDDYLPIHINDNNDDNDDSNINNILDVDDVSYVDDEYSINLEEESEVVEDDNNNDVNSVYDLDMAHRRAIENNDGTYSDQSIHDMYDAKRSKMSFDELSRVITGGN